ncbi:MAG: hypothetical protein Q9188_003325 [Gyalolechia gomerana]
MFFLACVVATIALLHQKSAALVELPTGSNQDLNAGRSYRLYRCDSGAGRPNAAIDCIKLLGILRQETTSPQNFNSRIWIDSEAGCRVLAHAVTDVGAAIVVPDVLDDLIFLLYRCFLRDRPTPSQAGLIRSGLSLSYRLILSPPQTLPPTVTGLTTLDLPLDDDRAMTQCRKRNQAPLSGKFTDCLPILLEWFNAPGSAEPRQWNLDDRREWSAPGCFIFLSFSGIPGIPDSFSKRSLIDDAVWIMGKCFAGPEAARELNEGYMSVGPLRMWTLRIIWGPLLGNDTNRTII